MPSQHRRGRESLVRSVPDLHHRPVSCSLCEFARFLVFQWHRECQCRFHGKIGVYTYRKRIDLSEIIEFLTRCSENIAKHQYWNANKLKTASMKLRMGKQQLIHFCCLVIRCHLSRSSANELKGGPMEEDEEHGSKMTEKENLTDEGLVKKAIKLIYPELPYQQPKADQALPPQPMITLAFDTEYNDGRTKRNWLTFVFCDTTANGEFDLSDFEALDEGFGFIVREATHGRAVDLENLISFFE
ncbi:hypothetical protein C0J52_04302 [Blattella germanica]|nr:hypothetical protein C0J52_04302 [Blattella germanica]